MSDYEPRAIPMTPEARWRHLRDEGQKELVYLETNDVIEDKPSWFDADLFAKAREAIQKYFLATQFSSFTGLLLILQLPDGLEPLLSTGNSKDIISLHKRYLATTIYVNSWYDDDVFNPDTKGYKTIRLVRTMHRRVQTNMNTKFVVPDLSGQLGRKWFNHYDVALTQWAFIGLLVLYPQKCGAILASKEEIELINYYWRVLGHLMGVKDEFNCCQFEKYDDIYQFMKLIFQHEYLDRYEESKCPVGLQMTQGICLAMHDYVPTLTFNSLAYWWQDCFQFNGYEVKSLTAKERVYNFTTSLSFNRLFKNETILKLMVKLHKYRFESRVKRKDKILKKLEAEYKDKTGYSFLSERVDYFLSCPIGVEKIEAGVCPMGFGASQSSAPQTVAVSA